MPAPPFLHSSPAPYRPHSVPPTSFMTPHLLRRWIKQLVVNNVFRYWIECMMNKESTFFPDVLFFVALCCRLGQKMQTDWRWCSSVGLFSIFHRKKCAFEWGTVMCVCCVWVVCVCWCGGVKMKNVEKQKRNWWLCSRSCGSESQVWNFKHFSTVEHPCACACVCVCVCVCVCTQPHHK